MMLLVDGGIESVVLAGMRWDDGEFVVAG